jgi:hypothetical protein
MNVLHRDLLVSARSLALQRRGRPLMVRSAQPQLAAALAACKKHKTKLVIAKLDRLSRNVTFIATSMESR